MIVYTGGTFDLFHAAHVELLRQCAKLAGPDGAVTVGLNTDEFITAYKGHPPTCSYDEREAVLRACRHVDDVVANSGGPDSRPVIETARPELLVIGTDWAYRDYYAQLGLDQRWLDERGITLLYVAHARSTQVSSTEIRRRIRTDIALPGDAPRGRP